jgi:2,3-bisphosphoglycerate-independent phosphoglycerate mutase
MKPAPMWDDRTPIMLITLDGLGDRPSELLENQTPLARAKTPNLDKLTAMGISGIHQPFGPGRATSSEVSHWAMFGQTQPFPGRAALEATGIGLEIAPRQAHFHCSLRPAEFRGGELQTLGRVSTEDAQDCLDLFDALRVMPHQMAFELLPLRNGECVLVSSSLGSHEISDSDPLFGHIHPVLMPIALSQASNYKAAQESATSLASWLRSAVTLLTDHPINQKRLQAGKPALLAPVTKWASWVDSLYSFEQTTGLRGAAVTSSALYRGLARTLDMTEVHIPSNLDDVTKDFQSRLEQGLKLTSDHSFVHVHTKATDEAGHTKDPQLKQRVIEDIDQACELILEISKTVTVAITGDHATPSSGGAMHSAHPTSLIMVGPHISQDSVTVCSEIAHSAGELGRVGALDILPLLGQYAHRSSFRGHAVGAFESICLPDSPPPLSFSENKSNNNLQPNSYGIGQ